MQWWDTRNEQGNISVWVIRMEFIYPINFVGYERGDSSGEVVTRDGEYLGKLILDKDDEEMSGEFRFIADGENELLFSEAVDFLDSGLHMGLALSTICQSIHTWHKGKDQA